LPVLSWYDDYNDDYFYDVIENGITIYTSGSSGTPKEIYQPPSKIKADAQNACRVQNINQDSKIYTCLNPTRAGGLFAQTIPGLIAGAEIDLAKFNPYEYVKVADKYTHTHLTPLQAKGVMKTKGFADLDLKGKTFLIGSEPVTYDIVEQFLERGATVITIWGMTEIGVNAIMHKFKSVFDLVAAKTITPPNSTILGNIFNCEWKVDNKCLWVKGDICVYNDWYNTKDQVLVDEKWGWLWYTGREGTPVDFNKPRKG
jgi:acyl-coenzyme A synthetase/AMP-(fatty) acid ligase